MILNEDEAIKVLKDNIAPPNFIIKARTQSNKLFALMQGYRFIDLLINQIENIESKAKAEARKKYSKNIIHYFDRLLRPVANVYSANGGSVHFDLSDNERDELLNKLANARDGKSLREWLKTKWMPLYHSDPNGVIFIEYESKPEPKCWPTFKNINIIRAYKPKGQLVDWILFEPVNVKINNRATQVYRLIDDKSDRRYKQEGNTFVLIKTIQGETVSFDHPFGEVPAIINSDIESFKEDIRLSPINGVIEISEEYALGQSVKSLYKKFMGFPKEWKYVDQCNTCFGAKKVSSEEGEKIVCSDCNGHGYYQTSDVTDIITLPIPEKDEIKITPDIGGFIVPPIEVWKQYNEELTMLDEMSHATHWGTMAGFTSQVQKTATEIFYDTQPMTDRLNDLSDVAEWVDNKITEWFANFIFPSKRKDKKISNKNYGRRFIIDPPDVILEKYEKAKREEDNDVIKDRLFNELLTSRFKRDPEFLRTELLKAATDIYLHLGIDQTEKTFGVIEAQRKALHGTWWKTLDISDLDKSADKLIEQFNKWFVEQQPEGEVNAETLAAQAELRGSVGGATVVKDIITAVSAGQIPKESAIKILEITYGYKPEEAVSIVGEPVIVIPTPPATGTGGTD